MNRIGKPASARGGLNVRRWVAGLLLPLALAACGGGTTQQTVFQPERLIAFGDEHSVLTPTGRKYTVNAVDATTGAIDCRANPLWTQVVAATYSFVFEECNPNNSLVKNALMRAAVGARVADLRTQVNAQVAAGGLTSKDLVTVLVGMHDVLSLYAQFPQRSEAELLADARARGEALAAEVNRIVGLGPRVLVATLPDLSFTPYALAQKAAFNDTDRAALLGRLVEAFNGRLRVNIVNDGRLVGLVLADETTQVMARFPSAFGFSNATEGACSAALPDCTTATVVAANAGTTYLWADATRAGPVWHNRVGLIAQQRAVNNPF
ncbi:MAG: esterase [Rubrivivax sp.]|jgi:outer membrane lipase/esterase